MKANKTINLSTKTNLLEQDLYEYKLQDVSQPELFREIFPYNEVPKVSYNYRHVPMDMPEHIYITDTSFRDGQQSREPYTTQQMVDLYKMLHRLGGPNGIVRQTEFFVYSKKDRDALERCMELGYEFPEITTWIRATKSDFELVKNSFMNRALSGFYHALNIQTTFETYESFYRKLTQEGFHTFGLDVYEEENIYIPWMYKDMKQMYSMEPADFLVQKSITRRVNNENNNIRRKILRQKNANLKEKIKVLQSDKKALQIENKKLNASKEKLQKEITDIKNTKAYKLGNKIMWMPRKVRNIFSS